MKLKYDSNILGYMNFFKKVTGIIPRDCFVSEETLIFITDQKKAGIAVGKNGKNIQNLRNNLKKDIKIFEYADSPVGLAANFVFPLKPTDIQVSEENIMSVQFLKGSERRYLLSNNQLRLKQLKEVIKRYYTQINEIIIPQ